MKLYFLCGLAGYLLGSFPTGVVLTRNKYGIDVREMGSGNIGATNVTRVFGWYAGAITFVIDCLKGFIPVCYVRYSFPNDPWLYTVTGASLVLGHCFSFFLRLRGGKGVATSLGCLLAVAPIAGLAAGLVYLVMLLITRISAVGSFSGIAVGLLFLAIAHPPSPVTWLVLSISIIVVLRHHANIRRLIHDLRTPKVK